ncbi:hypothetical protein PVK06_049147 [Gossypium arboreum]|uniref:Uncharacterized protein n=1 Tax=Gossypium arboreum TaxID=29729 RepID=A0ABR0MIC0_GOSAR|nr:hypothetical protein PVK06_049147 [Gossypium arboreum]
MNPNSVCGKILKAKYFSRGGFNDSTKGSSPLFRMVEHACGKSIIIKGAQWRFGIGNDIQVFNDPCLPDDENFYVVSNPLDSVELMKVSKFLHEKGMQCNEQLVEGILAPHDASRILNLPIATSKPCSQLIWHHTRNGIYNVKSGYAFAIQTKTQMIRYVLDGRV